jgi:PHD/YefM family antitoxin component YafN of YafNO toxin-antitoxin module
MKSPNHRGQSKFDPGRAGNGVLIAEDDWRSIQETLYLTSIPGMRSRF